MNEQNKKISMVNALNKGLNKGLKPLVGELSVHNTSYLVNESSCNTTTISDNNENQKPYHITWVTHNSRISERMIKFKVKRNEPIIFNDEQEFEITKYILKIAKENQIKVISYNICMDHVHILINCEKEKIPSIVTKLKSKSTYLYKKNHAIEDSISLWAQKYNCSYIETEEKFHNCIEYIKNNRKKHNLTENKKLDDLIEKFK